MPLYSYDCADCGAGLEILHALGKAPTRCGLDCQRKGGGSFGSGRLSQQISAPNLQLSTRKTAPAQGGDPAQSPAIQAEARRQEALSRLGGEVTEGELDKLRDSGMTVYRRSGEQRWEKDGGAVEAPAEISPSPSESS